MFKYEVTVYENGNKEWCLNGKRHREDGPAYINSSGRKDYYLNNVRVTEAEVMGHTITVDGKEVTLSAESYQKLKNSISG